MKNPWKRYSKINPQREDGNLQVNHDVMEHLIRGDFTASEYKIIFFIIRKTYGFGKKSDSISNSQFNHAVNLTARMIRITRKSLKERQIIYYQPSKRGKQGSPLNGKGGKQGSPINEYLFNKHYDTWKPRPPRGKHSSRKPNVAKGEIECQKRGKHSSPTIETSTIENNTINTMSEIEIPDQESPFPEINPNHASLRLSKLLFSLMLKNNEKAKKPNFEKWSEHIEKLIRIDKRSPGEIEHVIRWTQQDDFEMSNILSTEKLRKRFDQLWLKSNKPTKANQLFTKNLKAMEDFLNEQK